MTVERVRLTGAWPRTVLAVDFRHADCQGLAVDTGSNPLHCERGISGVGWHPYAYPRLMEPRPASRAQSPGSPDTRALSCGGPGDGRGLGQ